MSDKQATQFRRDLVIQAGMQLIPYVGAPMAALYFGAKQERRFERLENFYSELALEIAEMQESIKAVEDQDAATFEAILESLHEKIETEPTREKMQFFKNYFKNTLRAPVNGNYDERRCFLEFLSDMSMLECEVLAFIEARAGQVLAGSIQKASVDQYAIVGAIGRLKVKGFLIATQQALSIGKSMDNSLQEQVQVSPYGARFCKFCLNTCPSEVGSAQ